MKRHSNILLSVSFLLLMSGYWTDDIHSTITGTGFLIVAAIIQIRELIAVYVDAMIDIENQRMAAELNGDDFAPEMPKELKDAILANIQEELNKEAKAPKPK